MHSRLLDGEIEIAAIPDYCAHLRVKSYLDVFDVGDSVAVRARYEQERARGYSSDVEIHLATGAIPMGKGHRRTHEKP